MDQNIKAVAVFIEPRNQPVEFVGVEAELTAPARVLSHGTAMESTQPDMTVPPRCHTQRFGR